MASRAGVPTRSSTTRRAFVLASLFVLVVGAPTASARSTSTLRFGGGTHADRHVGAKSHTVSMREVAREAALHPRTEKPMTLHIPAPRVAAYRDAAKMTPARNARTASAPRPLIVLPDVAASTTFAGIDESEGGGWAPADPWIAANSSFLVQIVNNAVRVTKRDGDHVMTVPNEAFFQAEPGLNTTDGRIIWDATHGRWVGEVVYFANDLSENGIVLAISDGADPTAGWTLWPISFGTDLPDYPSIASSNDKVVFTDNLYDSSLVYQGADINTLRWSAILSGAPPADIFCTSPFYIHPRAAQVLSSSNDIHLVLVGGGGDQIYYRITGSGDCDTGIIDGTDMSSDLGFDSLVDPATVPEPRQPGPDVIETATDGRFTDAVWQNNHLYWVSTYPVTYDFGATWNDGVIVWATTTATSGSPSGYGFAPVWPGDTIDAYMGGIGVTRNGTPIVSYSQSSESDPITFQAAEITSFGTAGTIGTPVVLDTSEGSIDSERWGDFAGVAMDPTGNGSVWVTHMLAAGDGTWRTTIARMLVDSDSPSNPGTPGAAAVTGPLGPLPKYRISWSASTDAGSGEVVYWLEQNVDGGGFAYAGTLSGSSTVRSLSTAHTYQFRVLAIDPLGNTSGFTTGPVLDPNLVQSATSTTGTWHSSSSSNYSGGSTRYASAAGAAATYKSSGVRSLGFVTTKGSRGKFKVYIDGHLKGTFNASSSSTKYRQVMYQFSWSTAGTHSIKIVVVGTGSHPRVDVDAFLVLK